MRTVLQHWNWIRVARLLIGLAALGQGVWMKDTLMIIAGGFVAFAALANTGCCGTSTCAVPADKTQTKIKVDYETLDRRQ